MGKGELDGYFSYNDFWETYKTFQAYFPKMISQKIIIGNTY